jgi:mannosylglycoprotein endo-beta-mannosidase
MLVWKNQNPWTSLRGQFYDVYLDQNGAFYGFRHGAKPLHVQLNLNDSSICVLNQTYFDTNDLLVESELFDIHGSSIQKSGSEAEVGANSYKVVRKLFDSGKPQGFYFARLKLIDKKGELLDENLYWLTGKDSDWLVLEELQPADIQVSVTKNENGLIHASIENTGDETAFFLRLLISDVKSGELLLPVFMDDNYITLFPGEQRQIGVDLSHLDADAKTSDMLLQVAPWKGETIAVGL